MTNNKFIIKVKKKQVFFENYEKFLAKAEKCGIIIRLIKRKD